MDPSSLFSQTGWRLYSFIWGKRNSSSKLSVNEAFHISSVLSPFWLLIIWSTFNIFITHVICLCMRLFHELCFLDWSLAWKQYDVILCFTGNIYTLVCTSTPIQKTLPVSLLLCCLWVMQQYLPVQQIPHFKFGKVPLTPQWRRNGKT